MKYDSVIGAFYLQKTYPIYNSNCCNDDFTSVYGVVDGLFVSNVAGSESFAGVNLIMPALMMLGSVGFMIGTGGSALVSKTIGEGNKKLANRYLSMLIYFLVIASIV